MDYARKRLPVNIAGLLIAWTATAPIASAEPPRAVLELPECDIFLFDLAEDGDSFRISGGANITARQGYDNQPWFTADSQSILYTANGAPDRTDVYEYSLINKSIQQVTNTATQEYSPQVSTDESASDGKQVISYVTDGVGANQSIWFTKRGSGKEKWLLANQGEREPVGYYSWNRKTDDILYWSRYGFSLRLVHRVKKVSHYVTGNAPPSSPQIIPGTTKFSFLHRQGNGQVWIKELDPATRAIRPLTPTVGANNHYGWTPSGRILMIDGTILHCRTPEHESDWKTVADLAKYGLKSATRIAVSPNGKKLAVVGQQR